MSLLSRVRRLQLARIDRARLASAEGHEEKKHNRWLITYIDLFTALLGFFILIIVMVGLEHSTPKRNYQKIMHDLHQGVMLQKTKQKLGWLQVENTLTKGVRLTIDSSILPGEPLFASAKADINPRYIPYLVQLGHLFAALKLPEFQQRYRGWVNQINNAGYDVHFFIRVEGHTDARPLAATSFFRDNIELSTYRADAMRRFIQGYTGLPERYFSLAGYGAFHPVVTDGDAEQNRRVEIYLLPKLVARERDNQSTDNAQVLPVQEVLL